MFHFVNCTSSPEPVAESLADSFSAMCQSAPSNWRNTLGLSCSSDSVTESCPGSPSGTMFGPSMESLGLGPSTLSVVDSPARTFQRLGRVLGSPEPDPASGLSSPESSEMSSRLSVLSKTPLFSEREDWRSCWKTLPRWGSMRSGVLSERIKPAHLTNATGCGFLPTPLATLGTNGGPNQRDSSGRPGLQMAAMMWPTPTAMNNTGGPALCKWGGSGARAKLRTMVTPEELNGALNPEWVCWLMGWPVGWTDSRPLETAKFHKWLHSHGAPSCAA
jgi:hypothetical protein